MALNMHISGNPGTQCKLSDYVSNEAEIMDAFSSVDIANSPHVSGLQNSQRQKLLTPRTKISAYHIHRDLKSPIPNMRVLALQSIKSPLKNVPSQAEGLTPKLKSNVAEDKEALDPSIEEVMRNIVVYVEVRTGEDNRSAGVKKVIAALGARITNTLCRTTTHVIFKDGLMSTFRKAKSMKIPIVSILWIEACKLQRKLCDPAEFPISNLDRYENPELYEKMKRYKNMQPGAEGHKRVRAKKQPSSKSTGKGSTNKSSRSKSSPPSKSKRTPTKSPVAKVTDDSPATVLLKRMSSGAYTPLNKAKQAGETKSDATTPLNARQKSIETKINTATNSIAKMFIGKTKNTHEKDTPTHPRSPGSRRESFRSRRTIATSNSHQAEEETHRQDRDEEPGKELSHHNDNDSMAHSARRTSTRRRTTFSSKPMEITDSKEDTTSASDHQPPKRPGILRRTHFTPHRMLESPSGSSNSMVNSTKRRTLYTPQRMAIEQEKRIDDDENDESSISTPPISIECLSNDTPTSLPQNRRRRTLFDLSMDIISHQVKHLNTKTHLSLTPSNGGEENDDCSNRVENEKNVASDKNYAADSTENDDASSIVSTTETKKRKLFAPIEASPFTPPSRRGDRRASITESYGDLIHGTRTTPKSANKRRRTLVPKQSSTDETSSKTNLASEEKLTSLRPRRSTMDFEMIRKVRAKAIRDHEEKTKAGKENKTTSSRSKETIGDSPKPVARKRLPLLAFTNMHKEQVEVINEAVAKLGRFKLDRTVCGHTTHMVTLEARRTMNILRGLVRGLWILDYTWVTDSLKAGYWQPEEPYEMKHFSRAVEICRAERQAFGHSYRCELFADLGAFFISPRCDNVPIRDLKELIRMCGGKVEENRQKAKFILSSSTKAFDDKTYVTPLWILDSITQMQLMRVQKYSVSSELPTKQSAANTRNMPTAIDMKDPQKNSILEQINSNLKYSRKIKLDSDPSRIYSRTCTS